MAKRAYLLVYSDSIGSRDEIKEFLNSCQDIPYWYTCLPHSFFIVSEKSAKQLSILVRGFCGSKGRFLILHVDPDSDCDGWLPTQAWNVILEPSKKRP